MATARRTRLRLLALRTQHAAETDVEAHDQEASFVGSEENEGNVDLPQSAVEAVIPATSVASAINRKHEDRGAHAHFRVDEGTPDDCHQPLPKDAPAGEEIVAEAEIALRARVQELEERLRAMQVEQQLLVEREVSRRLLTLSPHPPELHPPSNRDVPEALQSHVQQPVEAPDSAEAQDSAESAPSASGSPTTALEAAEQDSTLPTPAPLPVEEDASRAEQRIAAGAERETFIHPPGPDGRRGVDLEPVNDGSETVDEQPAVSSGAAPTGPQVEPMVDADQPGAASAEESDTPPLVCRSSEAAASDQCVSANTVDDVGSVPNTIETEEPHHSAPVQLPGPSEEPLSSVESGAEAAAQAIQSACRGHLGRQAVSAARHLAQRAARHRAAVHVQCAFRQYLSRRAVSRRRREVAAEQLQRQRDAQLQMESAERAIAQGHQATAAAAREQSDNRAAAVIQRAYRCYNARFMLKWKRMLRQERRAQKAAAEELQLGHESVQRIQSFSRRMAAGQAVRELKKERSQLHERRRHHEERTADAAITIQCAWRSAQARFEAQCRRRQRDEIEERLLAKKRIAEELQLQKIREEEAESLRQLEEEKASLTMQLAWRSYNARFRKAELLRQKQERDAREQLLTQSVDVLKKVAGGYLARLSLCRLFLRDRQHDLARAAQPVGRGYLGRATVAKEHTVKQLGRATSDKAIERALSVPEREERGE